MGKPITHQLDVYDCGLNLALDRRAARTLSQRYGLDYQEVIEAVGSTSHAVHTVLHQSQHIVWLDLRAIRACADPDSELVNTCAHEASHVADNIAGGGLTGEGRAYLIGWVTAWLWGHAKAAG